MADHAPADADAVAATVAAACAAREGLAIGAGFSRAPLGRPAQTAHTLRLERLSGITDHDAPEFVLTALAATPLATIEAALAPHRQMLAFEPPDHRRLLGTEGSVPTIGGALSVNAGGPRRVTAGAARDHLLGFDAVNGRGERFRAGGRVVKNVTGYDLPKLVCCAYGTLAVLTEVTLRLHPRPETERTVVVAGLDDARAVAFLADALGSPHEVSAAAHLPDGAAVGLDGAVSAVRLEGFGPSVAFRAGAMLALAGAHGRAHLLEADRSAGLWRAVADVEPLAGAGDTLLWRLSVTPSRAPAILAVIRHHLPGAAHMLDWGGGLVWCALPSDTPGAGAAILRDTVAGGGGGHATLIRAPAAIRAAVPPFEPEPAALAALTARVKASFDPHGILNPGRVRPDL